MPRTKFSVTLFPKMPKSFFIIDIDGTLVPDGGTMPDADTRRMMASIMQNHAACITSNGKDMRRNEMIASLFGIPYAAGTKPFNAVARRIRALNTQHLPIIVVGDRYLTDGLLALRLNARFISVTAIRRP